MSSNTPPAGPPHSPTGSPARTSDAATTSAPNDAADAGHANANANADPEWMWCHECRMEIRPLRTPHPACPRCNGGFIEEIVGDPSADDVDFPDPHAQESLDAPWLLRGPGGNEQLIGGPLRPGPDRPSQPMPAAGGLSGLIGQLLGAAAGFATNGGGQMQDGVRRHDHNDDGDGDGDDHHGAQGAGSSSSLNFSWSVQTPSGLRQGSSSTASADRRRATSSNVHQPQTLAELMRSFADSPSERNANPWTMETTPGTSNDADPDDDVPFDDGMGGFGAAADGRRFNHDNRARPDSATAAEADDTTPGTPGAPPELAALRHVFSNILGPGMGGGIADLLGGALGGTGRAGDYVFGQGGLDNVITELMNQTQGMGQNSAPPAATEEQISELAKFKRHEMSWKGAARNVECPTCMDDFMPTEEPEASSNAQVDQGATSASSKAKAPNAEPFPSADDPPDIAPTEADAQEEDLIMMPCRHLYHSSCLVPWLEKSGTCPVCRISITGDTSPSASGEAAAATSGSRDAHDGRGVQGDDTDEENEEEDSPERRRERARVAAERRAIGEGLPGNAARTRGESDRRMPGSLELDDLD